MSDWKFSEGVVARKRLKTTALKQGALYMLNVETCLLFASPIKISGYTSAQQEDDVKQKKCIGPSTTKHIVVLS